MSRCATCWEMCRLANGILHLAYSGIAPKSQNTMVAIAAAIRIASQLKGDLHLAFVGIRANEQKYISQLLWAFNNLGSPMDVF